MNEPQLYPKVTIIIEAESFTRTITIPQAFEGIVEFKEDEERARARETLLRNGIKAIPLPAPLLVFSCDIMTQADGNHYTDEYTEK